MARRGLLDTALGVFGLQRASADGSFRGSRMGRTSSLFEQDRRSINSAIQSGGERLRARSRFACREDGLLGSAKETWTAYLVGSGLTPVWSDQPATRKRALQKAFHTWQKRAGIGPEGPMTFYAIQALASDECFEAGEVFVRLVRSEASPLRLQMLPAEQLPYNVSIIPTNRDHTIRLGIEFDAAGRRVAYHFWKHHPADSTIQAIDSNTVRIPAEEILHVFRVEQPGQIRGLPQTRSSLVPANKLNEYDDATIDRANVAAKFAVFLTKPEGEAGPRETGVNNEPIQDLENGAMVEGLPGEEPKIIQGPDPGNNYSDFRVAQATRACAGMGVPYAETTGDLRQTTFSSARIGRIPLKRRIKQRQDFTLVPQLCDPVVDAWLADGLLRGLIPLPRGAARTVEAYGNRDWRSDKWEYLEPKKDAEADVILLDAQIRSRSEIIEERGGDADETDERIAQDRKRSEKLGNQPKTATATTTSGEDEQAERREAEEDKA